MNLAKEQIEQMPAGPEMDRLLGEKLGLPQRTRWDGYTAHNYWPGYSTDMTAAWQIVELLVKKAEASLLESIDERFEFGAPQFKHSNRYLTHEGYPLGTTCWLVRVISKGRRYNVCAETAPLAICRASLLTTLARP